MRGWRQDAMVQRRMSALEMLLQPQWQYWRTTFLIGESEVVPLLMEFLDGGKPMKWRRASNDD